MTYADFIKGMTGEQLAYAQNLQGQRDDAITRIDANDAGKAKLLDDHATEKATLTKERDDAKALVTALGGTELGQQLAKDQELAALIAAKAEAVARQKELDDKIAAMS